MEKIHLISNNNYILPVLIEYLNQQGFESITIPIQNPPMSESSYHPNGSSCDVILADMIPQDGYLLLVEPFQIGLEWYNISTSWKPWLMEHRPFVNLLVAAFEESNHTNCLNLLNLPPNLKDWVKTVKIVSSFRLVESYIKGELKYIDPWEIGLAQPGINLNAKMRKFINGHESSKSLIAQVAKIRNKLIDQKVRKLTTIEYEKCSRSWELISGRWDYYSKESSFVPYQMKMHQLREEVKEIKKELEEATVTFHSPDIKKFDLLIDATNKDLAPYIFPELYW